MMYLVILVFEKGASCDAVSDVFGIVDMLDTKQLHWDESGIGKSGRGKGGCSNRTKTL